MLTRSLHTEQCPVYAIEAWLGLALKEESFLFDVLREVCYWFCLTRTTPSRSVDLMSLSLAAVVAVL